MASSGLGVAALEEAKRKLVQCLHGSILHTSANHPSKQLESVETLLAIMKVCNKQKNARTSVAHEPTLAPAECERQTGRRKVSKAEVQWQRVQE